MQREGGWVAAPVFHRVAQQVLEYLHTPHDLEIPADRKVLLARANSEKDLEEGPSQDRLGEALDLAGAAGITPEASLETPANPPVSDKAPSTAGAVLRDQAASAPAVNQEIVPAAMRESLPAPQTHSFAETHNDPDGKGDTPQSEPKATIVLDVEQGGITVPSFIGKSVRSAIEMAESSGIDLDVVGNGVGQEQNPPAGSIVPAGTSVTVHFGR